VFDNIRLILQRLVMAHASHPGGAEAGGTPLKLLH
jgi:hypothetical protein